MKHDAFQHSHFGVSMAAEPVSGSAAAYVFVKYLGPPVAAGAMATALGFIVLWPRTRREGFARFFTALLSSFTFGPILAFAAYNYAPGLFVAGAEVAVLAGMPREVGIFSAAAPFLVIAALPAWWVLGWVVLFFDRRRNKDLGDVVRDFKRVAKAKD